MILAVCATFLRYKNKIDEDTFGLVAIMALVEMFLEVALISDYITG